MGKNETITGAVRLDRKIKRLRGKIAVNGDKSITHRSIIFGALAEGETRVRNYLRSEDCECTMNAFRMMGVKCGVNDTGELVINGAGAAGLSEPQDVVWLGNSGTSLRLLTGLFASCPQLFTVLTGDASLVRRPMKRVVEPLSKMGAEIWGREGANMSPLAIRGRRLSGIEYNMPVASAQVKSAIILASLNADGESVITEPVPSRDHTERMLNYFGGTCITGSGAIRVKAGGKLTGKTVSVPGDISSAAFFIVAGLIHPDADILIENVGINPLRTGIIDALRNMGGNIEIRNERDISGEPVGDIAVTSSRLKGVAVGGKALIPRMIDEIPVLAVAAAFAEGQTVITDAAELRVKESDRILSVSSELSRLGVDITPQADGMIINGGRGIGGGACKSYMDHRVVMSLAIAAMLSDGDITVDDATCVNTSFPDFFNLLEKLSIRET